MLVEFGDTRVLCAASVEERVPTFLKDSGQRLGHRGIRHAAARHEHPQRARGRARQAVGPYPGDPAPHRAGAARRHRPRCARAAHDPIDCDVLQADGGTRTAAITGGFVALHDALAWLASKGAYAAIPVADFVAAVSVGVYQGTPILDLDYAEDSACGCDMNVVMTGTGGFVEIQGTAEGATFSRRELDALLGLAEGGIMQLVREQRRTLGLG